MEPELCCTVHKKARQTPSLARDYIRVASWTPSMARASASDACTMLPALHQPSLAVGRGKSPSASRCKVRSPVAVLRSGHSSRNPMGLGLVELTAEQYAPQQLQKMITPWMPPGARTSARINLCEAKHCKIKELGLGPVRA